MKMKRATTVIASLSLLVAGLFFGVSPAAALSCGSWGTITYYDGSGGTGVSMTLCATEYPASNESCSFDQSFCKFTDGSLPDNRIQSNSFANAHAGVCIHVFTGYYFSGYVGTVCKPSSGSQVINWGGVFYNGVSSLLSCGTDGCADNP